jgi:hypothetical protein
MSREQWRARVQSSRERAEIARRERKTSVALPPKTEELAEEASKRVLEDDRLRPGDVVSTNRGLFRFQGPLDKERRPGAHSLTKTSESAAARVLAIPILQHPSETSVSGLV